MGAVYNGMDRHIRVSAYLSLEPDSLAGLLVHEGTHAKDHATGLLAFPKQTLADHIQPELRAYRAQAQFWSELYPNGKHERNETDFMHNRTLEDWRRGTLDYTVSRKYANQWHAALREIRRSA